ncbi:MAG: hypothetical protein DRP87_07410 [Spirochaetes bacterium]|nr:MAG: hypothetical protein DRP87_07410 [Spirochaetota bacterium]
MKLPHASVKHPVTVSMVFLGLFILGLVSLSRLGLELFPDITMPTVAIFTVYPGVSPYEIESSVTRPIEEVVSSLNGVEEVSSTSSEGVSMVIINFTWGTNMETVVPEIREKLNTIQDDLPEGAEMPGIYKFNPEHIPSLTLNISAGLKGIDVRRLVEDKIVPELEKIKGVARVDLFGGEKRAVLCRLDLDTLGKLEIPLSRILQAFRNENINLPGGFISLEDRYFVLRTVGEFKNIKDIENVLVDYKGNVPVFLGDVADVSLASLPREEFVRTEEGEGVVISVYKQPGYNTVEVNRNARQTVENLEKTLPPSVKIEVQSDQSTSVIRSIGGVANAAWQGGLLAVLVLVIFLRNFRSTLIIATVIPISVIATFSLMDFGKLTVNMVSLMGITLGIGMFVDNSIVVLESVYRKQLAGYSPEQAAVEGTSEVGKAITASTLTTMAVFLPIIFVEGLAGLLFQDLSMTISFALAISLAVALTFIPVLCARFLRIEQGFIGTIADNGKELHELSLADVELKSRYEWLNRIGRAVQNALKWLDETYEKVIIWALEHSLIVIISAVILLGISAGSVLLLGMEFLPEADEARFAVSLETKPGVPFAYTEQKVIQIERIIRSVAGKDLKTMASSVGRGGERTGLVNTGSNLASIHITLVDKDSRSRSIWEITREISSRIEEDVLDVEFNTEIQGMASLASSATGETSPIVYIVSGNNLDVMNEYAQSIATIIESTEGTRDVRVSHESGQPELQFLPMRKQALSLGITPLEIASTIRTAYKGMEVSRYTTEEEDYDVILLLKDEDRNNLDKIKHLFFINPAGNKIPIENVVEIKEEKGPRSVNRKSRTRIIKIEAALTGERPLNKVVADIDEGIESLGEPPLGITLSSAGSAKEMASSFGSLSFALILAVALVYMVMASQFESFLHPFIVMFSVPFAAIGMVIALMVTGTTFNLIAFIGAILLVGIVVNNAIVLIDYINLLRARGVPVREAIIQGGRTRLKPILMTALTTIFGLLPMALGIGTGSELRAPMGRAVVGGLTTSTLVTLVLIPAIYWLIEGKLKEKVYDMLREK